MSRVIAIIFKAILLLIVFSISILLGYFMIEEWEMNSELDSIDYGVYFFVSGIIVSGLANTFYHIRSFSVYRRIEKREEYKPLNRICCLLSAVYSCILITIPLIVFLSQDELSTENYVAFSIIIFILLLSLLELYLTRKRSQLLESKSVDLDEIGKGQCEEFSILSNKTSLSSFLKSS